MKKRNTNPYAVFVTSIPSSQTTCMVIVDFPSPRMRVDLQNIFIVYKRFDFIGCEYIMTCPYYIDFTRDCIRTYPAIIQYKDFSSCESERYQKCMVYSILQSDFRCQYLQTCLNMFPDDIPEFFRLLNQNQAIYEFVTKPTYQYCLSNENHIAVCPI